MKQKWWQYEGVGLKKFLSLPKFKVWQIGSLLGVLFIIVGWRVLKFIAYSRCGTTIEGLFCNIFYLVLFIIICVAGGIILTYFVKMIVEKIREQKN